MYTVHDAWIPETADSRKVVYMSTNIPPVLQQSATAERRVRAFGNMLPIALICLAIVVVLLLIGFYLYAPSIMLPEHGIR